MAKITLSLLLLLLSLLSLSNAASPAVCHHSQARAFIESQCRATRYPKLCIQYLSNFANTTTAQSQQQLAHIALMVSLGRARYTQTYVNKVAKKLKQKKAKDYQAMKDCLDQINDGVDQLTESVKEMRNMGLDGEGEFMWHQSNVQTWGSTALTDATTCIDGFSGHAMGGKVKVAVKAKVLNAAQVTSNALALFNRFAARHKAPSKP